MIISKIQNYVTNNYIEIQVLTGLGTYSPTPYLICNLICTLMGN